MGTKHSQVYFARKSHDNSHFDIGTKAVERVHIREHQRRNMCIEQTPAVFRVVVITSMCLPRSCVYRKTILYNSRAAGRKIPNPHSQDLLYCAHLNNGFLPHKRQARATTDSLIR